LRVVVVAEACEQASKQASKQAVSLRAEEYSKSASEDLTCALQTLCVCYHAVALGECNLGRLL
jgi:hypothetical protein